GSGDERLREELAHHVALQADENVRLGMSPEEARRQALLKLGSREAVREQYYEERSLPVLEYLQQDVRFALRQLRKASGFTAVAVLTLALGIGANTAVFSVVYSVLLQPLPYRDAARLVVMNETAPNVGLVGVSYPNFLDWRAQSRTVAEMAVLEDVGFNLSGVTEPQSIRGLAVSPNLLATMGIRPVIGRDFVASEEEPGTAPVVLLGYSLWQRRFAGSPGVLGLTITLDGHDFTVVGVLPSDFLAPSKADVLIPIGIWIANNPKEANDRGDRGDMIVLGRLAPGVTGKRATAEMEGIAARLAKEFPVVNDGTGVALQPIRDTLVGQTRPALLVLFGAVILVLLIACANVANLFLVRWTGRTREMALRMALGASTSRIVVQMLTESAVLSLCGGLLGLGVALGGVRGLGHLIPSDLLPGGVVGLNIPVLLFAAAIVLLAALVFGITPALHSMRTDVQSVIKEGSRTSSAASHRRVRGALAISEAALALVLLVGAGLMVKSLYRLLQVDPGFRPNHVLTMTISLRPDQYSKGPAVRNFWEQVLRRVRALPGVDGAAVSTNTPMTGNHDRADVTIDGMSQPLPGHYPHPDVHVVSPGYLQTLGITLLRGRSFAESDNEHAPSVAMINDRLAKQFFPGQDPIGKRFMFGHPGSDAPKWLTIVGVVADTRLYGLANVSRLEVYAPFQQNLSSGMDVVVKSRIGPAALAPAVRAAVHAVDANQSIASTASMNQLVNDSLAARRVTLVLLGLFSALALVLGAIGIYGVVSYSVAQRTREIGVRIALGAPRAGVFRMVIGQGMRLAVAGIVIGILVALGLARLMSSLLYEVSAADFETFTVVAAVLLLIALAASYFPARRATSVDPIVALRSE
ncbi:MAG: ADOP family duplicated permease, partial [Gemmatimonadaceae bacterium]